MFDVFKNVGTKIAAKLTGKAAKEIATKAATKAFEKGAEKVGEKTGQLIGEKIYNKFTDKPTTITQPQAPQPQVPTGSSASLSEPSARGRSLEDIGTQLMKDLQKDKSWLPRERSTPRAPPKKSSKKDKSGSYSQSIERGLPLEEDLFDDFDELFLK